MPNQRYIDTTQARSHEGDTAMRFSKPVVVEHEARRQAHSSSASLIVIGLG
jgi:hypothetical protein